MCPRNATSDAWLDTFTIDPPRPEPDHGRRGVLRDEQRAAGVHADDPVEHRDVGVHGGGDLAAVAAAVDHPVDVEALQRAADVVLGGEVERQRAAARLLRQRLEPVLRAARGDHVGARAHEVPHGRAADAAARPGDQDGPAVEIAVHRRDRAGAPVTGVTQFHINGDTSGRQGLTPVTRAVYGHVTKRRLAGAPPLQRRSATVTVTTATPLLGASELRALCRRW